MITKMKFADMPGGTIFYEIGSKKPRRFIKLQTVLPSGLTNTFFRRCVGTTNWGEIVTDSQELPLNSIDLDGGIGASCPGWLEFNVEKFGHKESF